MPRTHPPYPAECKAEAVRLARRAQRPPGAGGGPGPDGGAAEWLRRADVDTGKGPPGALTTDERDELRRLRRENQVLEQEREIREKSGGLLREGDRVSR